MTRRVALSIAGSDPSGGAGIQADLKTFTALGVYGAAAITCLTVQNTGGVSAFAPVEPRLVRDQIAAVLNDLPVSHVKIGMIGSAAVAEAVAEALANFSGEVIYDPVLAAGDGHKLLPAADLKVLKSTVLERATVLTPNLPELTALSGQAATEDAEIAVAAAALFAALPRLRAMAITGGHRRPEAAEIVDLLLLKENAGEKSGEGAGLTRHEHRHPRLAGGNFHGTGCTFAAALAACHLKCGAWPEAFQLAAAFTEAAIKAGAAHRIGRGPHHPLAHQEVFRR